MVLFFVLIELQKWYNLFMLEARTFVKEIDTAKKILDDNKAFFKGEYVCRDIIFSPRDLSKNLGDEFLRLRINEKNIWKEKDVILTIKQTQMKEIGKNSIIPVRKEFDKEIEAREWIKENMASKYKLDFEFTRTGWQYNLEDNQVDLEIVENVPNCYTIEIKSFTEEGLRSLVDLLHLENLINGPMVLAMKKLLS